MPFQRAAVANPKIGGPGPAPVDPARLTEQLTAGKLGAGPVPPNATEAGVGEGSTRDAGTTRPADDPSVPVSGPAPQVGDGSGVDPRVYPRSTAEAHQLSEQGYALGQGDRE